MAHGVSDPSSQGYFYRQEDATQISTAQRSTFSPSTSNKLSNWFLKRDNPHLNKIGTALKRLRQLDLVARGVANNSSAAVQRLGVKVAGGLDNLRLTGHPLAQAVAQYDQEHKLRQINERTTLKKERLAWKSQISAAAPGEMAATVEKANVALQNSLQIKGYRPLQNLSEVALQSGEPLFMRHANGHRVRLADQRFPFLARKVAEMGSRQYENGVTGLERAAKRGSQYGLMGISSGLQLLKQAAYRTAASIVPSASEESMTLRRHAGRARDIRRLNSAALKGNRSLADKFEQIQQEQQAQRQADLSAAGYEPVAGQHGTAPLRTRYSSRKMNDYFGAPETQRPAYLRKLARGYVSLVNVGDHVASKYHALREKSVSSRADAAQAEQSRNYHAQQRFKAQFRIDSSLAAVQGKMEELKDDETVSDSSDASEES
jgi:hypothetical protein